MPFKKLKKPRGVPFEPGDNRAKQGGRPSDDTETIPRVREPKSVFDNVSSQLGAIPPGATLRPYDDSDPKYGHETL